MHTTKSTACPVSMETQSAELTPASIVQLRNNDSITAVLALVQHAHLLGVLVSEEVEVVPDLFHLHQ